MRPHKKSDKPYPFIEGFITLTSKEMKLITDFRLVLQAEFPADPEPQQAAEHSGTDIAEKVGTKNDAGEGGQSNPADDDKQNGRV